MAMINTKDTGMHGYGEQHGYGGHNETSMAMIPHKKNSSTDRMGFCVGLYRCTEVLKAAYNLE